MDTGRPDASGQDGSKNNQPQKDPRSFAKTRNLQKEAANGTVQTHRKVL